MSDEAMSTDVDMDWDNIEETAPSLEDGIQSEEGEIDDEWAALGTEDESVEAKSEDSNEDSSEAVDDSEEESDDSGKEPEESVEAKDADSDEEVKEGEEKGALNVEELPDDTKLMVKVDGELQEITLKDYKNGISGEKAIAQRFNEYNVKEKEFNQQMNEVNEYINELGSTMRDAGVLEGVTKIGELVGMAPHQIKEALLKEIAPELERRYGMSEEEIALELQTQENSYLKEQSESNNMRLKQEQAQRELDAHVSNLREAHNISSQEWKEYESALSDHYAKEEITPELVVNYNNFKQAESRAESLIDSFDASFKSDTEVMDALVENVYDNPNLSDDDFLDILETALGKSKEVAAEAKVEKTVKSKASKKKAEPKEDKMFNPVIGDNGDEIDDWDDLL